MFKILNLRIQSWNKYLVLESIASSIVGNLYKILPCFSLGVGTNMAGKAQAAPTCL